MISADEKCARVDCARGFVFTFVASVFGASLLYAAIGAAAAPATTRDFPAKVIDCHDGDTCNVDVTEQAPSAIVPADLVVVHHDSVRLCGVNAPELRGETLATAKFARDRLLEWIRAAKVVTFRAYVRNGRAEREKYGRLLGWIVADGVVLNDRLVTEGLAVKYIECN